MQYFGAPAEGAAHYASAAWGQTDRLNAEAVNARNAAIGTMLQKREAMREGITNFANLQQQKEAAKKAAAGGGSGGAIGAGVGAVAGAVLAPFTFGASLALIPAIAVGASLGGSLGGAVGGAIDPPTGGGGGNGAGIASSLAATAGTIGSLYTANPYYRGPGATGQYGLGAGPGGAPVQSTQLR